jgi:hypothetical protein
LHCDWQSNRLSATALLAILAGSLDLDSTLAFVLFNSPIAPFWPQAIGFYACIMIRGVHSVTKSDFLAIMVPINAAVYAAIIFVAWHIFAAKQISNLRVDAPATVEVRESVRCRNSDGAWKCAVTKWACGAGQSLA